MRTRTLHFILLLAILSVLTGGCISDEPVNFSVDPITDDDVNADANIVPDTDRDIIYQFSTINALLEGVYEGGISCGELKGKGDFGLGTFDDLDGEMLKLDGIIYQIRADGNVYEVEDPVTSPFAAVTFFETDIKDTVTEQMNSQQMEAYIQALLPSPNIMYAVKITGNFDYMKTRSVAAQQRPYPRLVDVTKDQSVFEFTDTEGTIVGYWLPEHINGINVPGYHMHFITKDRTGGGHILEYTMDFGTIEIDSTDRLYLELPANQDYLNMAFSPDLGPELEEAEN